MMTFLFIIQFCTTTCEELRDAHGDRYLFDSFEACKVEIPFIKEERKGRLSCQGRAFEFSLVRR